ncbi:MAG: ribonuclease HI [Calditrichae bacterium]|nr:ribonuclease HI [Calditrichia bacterium]
MSSKIIVYCDGACAGNQNQRNIGGWGVVIRQAGKTRRLYGGEKNTTNNRMELTACIKALEAVEGAEAPIEIYSDSAYLVNCFQQRWYVNWQRNGWKNAKKQPVENQDLWQRILALVGKAKVSFHKVKGHAGVELNELADGLANRGMDELNRYPAGFSKAVGEDEEGPGEPEPATAEDERLRYRAVEGGYLLRLQRGARVMETLNSFILRRQIAGGTVSAIGALEDVDLGYFRLSDRQYLRQNFPGIYELISFMGNISYVEGKPFVHAHATLGDEQYRPVAGHFFDGTVAVTMEIYIRTFSEKVVREADDETGLKLLAL